MAGSFRFLEDVALADAAFEATGDSPDAVFAEAARAVLETMADPATVAAREVCRVELQAADLPALFFDWLSRIVFLKDARGLVFHEAALTVRPAPDGSGWRLEGSLAGEAIDPARHELRGDVKAITKHLFELRQEQTREGTRWTARVVMDL